MCWNMGFGEQTWWEDSCWLHRDSLRGQEYSLLQPGTFTEKARAAIEARCPCCGGRLFPLVPAPCSQRASHLSRSTYSLAASWPPPTWAGSCAPITTRTDASRLSICRGGAEITAELEGLCNLEEELKSPLVAVWTKDLHLYCQNDKFNFFFFSVRSLCFSVKGGIGGLSLISFLSNNNLVTFYKQEFCCGNFRIQVGNWNSSGIPDQGGWF